MFHYGLTVSTNSLSGMIVVFCDLTRRVMMTSLHYSLGLIRVFGMSFFSYILVAFWLRFGIHILTALTHFILIFYLRQCTLRVKKEQAFLVKTKYKGNVENQKIEF